MKDRDWLEPIVEREGIDYVVCRLCGCRMKYISESHLKHKHGITLKKYREMFPDVPIVCEEYRKKLSERIKKTYSTTNHSHKKLLQVLSNNLKSDNLDTDEYVTCRLCGKRFKRINVLHLLKEHGITIEEYKSMFPNAKLECKETSRKRVTEESIKKRGGICPICGKYFKYLQAHIRMAHEGKIPARNPEIAKKIGKKHRGRKLSEEHRRKIGEGVKRAFQENPKAKQKAIEALRKYNPLNDPVKRQEFIKRISQRMKENNPMKNPEIAKKVSEKLKGRKLSEETKKKMSEARKGKTWEQIYSPERIEELKRKISERMKGDNNPMRKYPKIAKRAVEKMIEKVRGKTYEEIYGKEKAKILKELRKIQMLLNNPMKNPETRKKLSEIRKQLIREGRLEIIKFYKGPNKQEWYLLNLLNELFPREFTFNKGDIRVDIYYPDFVHTKGKKIAIELYGCYWHACPKCFPNDPYAKEIHKHDRERLKIIFKHGWKVLVIWEHELQNPEKLKRKIRKWLNKQLGKEQKKDEWWWIP